MSLAVSTENYLETWGASRLTAPTAATGCDESDLYTGGLGLPFITSGAASSHTFDIHTDGQSLGTLAIFGVQASGATVTSVTYAASAAFPIIGVGASLGTIALNSRGDGMLEGSVAGYEAIRITVTLSASAVLSVGAIWAGPRTTLSRGYATRSDEPDYATIVNTSETRSVRTAELGDYIERFSLGFDRLLDAERDEVLDVFHEVRGAKKPMILIPDDDVGTEVYFGRIQRTMRFGIDYPVNTGLAFTFTEDGRPNA